MKTVVPSRLRRREGFTLVEIVLAIALLAIAIPSLLQLTAQTAVTGAKAAILPTANELAIQLMEEAKGLKFDELTQKTASGNWSLPGLDGGENTADKSTFDDVDDFNGWVQTFGASYPGYTASVAVRYVFPADLNAPVTAPSPLPNNWTPSFKWIQVTIANPALAANITLTTVVTEVSSL